MRATRVPVLLGVLVLFPLPAGSACAGVILALRGASVPGASLVMIEPETGSTAVSGDLQFGDPEPGPAVLVSALAREPGSNRLLGFGKSADGSFPGFLFELDPASGEAMSLGALGVEAISALAFSPEGILYGILFQPSEGGGWTTLGIIDPEGPRWQAVGGTGHLVNGITFQPGGGMLGVTQHWLLEIDPASGSAQPLTEFYLETEFQGIASGEDGLLFAVRTRGDDNSLHAIDIGRKTIELKATFPAPFTIVFTDCPAPRVHRLEPDSALLGQSPRVQLRGSGFCAGGITVEVGGSPALQVERRGIGLLELEVPPSAAAGAVDVRVTTPAGSAVLPGGFLYASELTVDFSIEERDVRFEPLAVLAVPQAADPFWLFFESELDRVRLNTPVLAIRRQARIHDLRPLSIAVFLDLEYEGTLTLEEKTAIQEEILQFFRGRAYVKHAESNAFRCLDPGPDCKPDSPQTSVNGISLGIHPEAEVDLYRVVATARNAGTSTRTAGVLLSDGEGAAGAFQLEIPRSGTASFERLWAPRAQPLSIALDPEDQVPETDEENNVVDLFARTAFVRGDADQSGAQNITDAIFILEYLFLSDPSPACTRGLDTNVSGVVDLSDAVYLLSFLFLGGPAPAAPFPACGLDPAPSALSCASFAACP